MNILEAAAEFYGMTKEEMAAYNRNGSAQFQSFYAGAAFGALDIRMSQEEILKAMREPAPPMARTAALTYLVGASKSALHRLEILSRYEPVCQPLVESLRAALAGVAESTSADPGWLALSDAVQEFMADFENSSFQSANPKWQAVKAAMRKLWHHDGG